MIRHCEYGGIIKWANLEGKLAISEEPSSNLETKCFQMQNKIKLK